MYAIVKTGGKQYRVEQGQSLLVERLSASEGDKISLNPLLYVDGSNVVDQVDGLSGVTVEARVVGHERGPKLRVVKFKPKRGYKRRNGHRQELTRIEVVSLKLSGGGRKRGAKAASAEERVTPVRASAAEPEKASSASSSAEAKSTPAAPKATPKPKDDSESESEAAATPKRSRSASQRSSRAKPKEEGDGS